MWSIDYIIHNKMEYVNKMEYNFDKIFKIKKGINMTIGQKIKELRIQKSMTQKELSFMLNISQQALSHYEMGDRDISLDLLKKICVIFDITSDELLEIANRTGISFEDFIAIYQSLKNSSEGKRFLAILGLMKPGKLTKKEFF